MGRVNWKQVVEVVRTEVVPAFNREGVRPTLRTIFYSLVSRNLIPNTKSAYKRLSEVLVKARKDGLFEWDFMEDRVRYAIKRFSDYRATEDDLERVERDCKYKAEEIDLNELLNSEFDYLRVSSSVGYWAEQPVIPEVWVEKDALASTLDNWLWDLHVNIRVNRGYSSWTFIYENVRELRNVLETHEKVVILYCGDLDPSGIDIQRFLREALEYFGMDESKVELIRVAVTPEQVEQYNLPPRPEDMETLLKLQRDPRSKNYSYNYIVELDALVAFVPPEFRRIIREAVERYHDKDVYNRVRREAEELAERSREIVENYKKEALRKILEQARRMLEEGA
ncbi:hypothetical protein [Archaeoglobus sp.]